jgi:hypothetical protein
MGTVCSIRESPMYDFWLGTVSIRSRKGSRERRIICSSSSTIEAHLRGKRRGHGFRGLRDMAVNLRTCFRLGRTRFIDSDAFWMAGTDEMIRCRTGAL